MQKKLWVFIKANLSSLAYSGLWIITFILILLGLRIPLDTLDLSSILGRISQLTSLKSIVPLILGIMAVSSLCLFDFILSKKLQLQVKAIEIFKIAWISHTSGNHLINIGSKYSGIRYFLYKMQGVENKKATLMSIVRNTLFISHDENGEVYLDKTTRFKLIGAIILRWFIASFFFAYIMGSVQVTSSALYLIFLLAVFLGRLSKIPGGLGVFDITCIVGIYGLNNSLENVVAGVLLYRIYYYIIPWIISMLMLSINIIKHKNIKLSQQKKHIIQTLGIQAIAALMFFTGLFSLITAYLPHFQRTSSGYTQFIYMSLGLLTIILSKSIYDKISSSYFITLMIITLTIIYGLLKHFSYVEIGLLLLLGILVYFSKDCFYRKPRPFKWSSFGLYTIVLGIISMLYINLYNTILLDGGATPQISLSNPIYIILLVIMAMIGGLLLSWVQVEKPSFLPPTEDDLERLTQFLNKYEGNSMTHLLFLKDKSLFYGADNQVLIGFRPFKDKLIALGDPIGDTRYFDQAIREFRVYAHQFDMTPLFYEVSDRYLSSYHENGFKFLKLGEEAIVHLRDFTLVGKRGAPLRTIKNKMDRGELEFELLTPPITPEVMEQLKTISDTWLNGRREKGFSLGFFDEEYINRAPVGIVRKDGKIVGFTTIMPLYNDHTVSIDLMRLIPNPPNGAMDALFLGIILWAIDEGYEKFIVGKAPLSNVGTHQFCNRNEKVAKYIYQYGNRIYSFKGLRRYKEKFYPEWEGTYLAYPKGTNLSVAVLNLTRLISGTDDTKG